jgi:hypothetical protein
MRLIPEFDRLFTVSVQASPWQTVVGTTITADNAPPTPDTAHL